MQQRMSGQRTQINELEEAMASRALELTEAQEALASREAELFSEKKKVEETKLELFSTVEKLTKTTASLETTTAEMEWAKENLHAFRENEKILLASGQEGKELFDDVLSKKVALHGVIDKRTSLERCNIELKDNFVSDTAKKINKFTTKRATNFDTSSIAATFSA